jgi:tetratricopeptide (TPR) repeat protein
MNSMSRKIFLFLLLLIACITSYSQVSREQKYARGVENYKLSRYNEALEEWLEIYNTGYVSANLNYNIGNAYFKLNNVPGAVLFYERAYLLKPGDEDINYNLQIARTLVTDKFEEIPELFFIRWFDYLALTLTTNSWAKLSMTAFAVFLLSFSIYLYSSNFRIKVTGFWIALIFFIISVSSLTLSDRNRKLVYDSHAAIIFNSQVSGKSSPDTSGTDLFVLHEGTKVTVEDEVGNWYEIRLSDGNKGWVPSESLKKI